MAQSYGGLASAVSRCTHGLPSRACAECRAWRLRAWGVLTDDKSDPTLETAYPPAATPTTTPAPARRPRAERGPTIHGEDRKPAPPTREDGRRAKRAARKAESQAAFRRLAGLPDEPPPPPAPVAAPLRTVPVQPTTERTPSARPRVRAVTPPRIGSSAARTIRTPTTAPAPLIKRPWTPEKLRGAVTEGWFDRDSLALFMYMDSRDVVLDFKDGHPAAVAEVLAWFRGTMKQIAGEVRQRGCRYLVAAPRHTPGPARASAEELCRQLAAAVPGLEHLPGALVRARAVTSGYHDGQRSSEAQHLATIRYAGPDLGLEPGGFLLFDDVFTSGATSSACRQVITRATRATSVTAIFITKTSARRSWQPGLGIVRRSR